MKKSNNMTTLPIAGAFIGTIVGAGFATGQEVFQFFTLFSWKGLWGILVATILFCYLGIALMNLSRRINASSHLDLVHHIFPRKVGRFMDAFITISFLGVLVVMSAGAGAVAHEQLGFHSAIGSIVIMVLTFVTVISGTRNVIRAIGFIVPFLLVAVFGVSLYALITMPITIEKIVLLNRLTGSAAPNWFFSSLLYVSYNMILAIAILAPLGVATLDNTNLIKGGLLGGVGLGLGILAINLAMISGLPTIMQYEVPMIFLASYLSPLFSFCYSLILLLEIYTTAVSILYGFVARVSNPGKSRIFSAGVASIAALLASQVGFSRVILTVYPFIGYVGLLFIACVFWASLPKK